jgi:hypothetical protein
MTATSNIDAERVSTPSAASTSPAPFPESPASSREAPPARTILPLAYLGGVGYFSLLARGGCVVDIGENWVKQTARNRAEILTAGGPTPLTVPVHGYGGKVAMRDVRIDHSKRWRHTHWGSIASAYRAAPFFDHYEERFAAVYARQFEFLVDLNMELLRAMLEALRLPAEFTVSESWVAASPADLDLRGKKALRRPLAIPPLPVQDMRGIDYANRLTDTLQNHGFTEYTQVFHDRLPFEPDLSALDLLLCEGPSARRMLLPR